jgi:glutathione S-transferase
VPTLEDGDLVITESAAIVLHVGDRFPESGLNPPVGTPERSLLYRRLIFLTNTLQATLMRWFYPERYTTDPAGAEALQARAAEELRVIYDQLERDLEGREWIVGDSRTGADLYLFMLTRWGRFQEPAAWDRPNLRAHFLRSLELPGVRRMVEEQELDLPEFAA